MDVRGQDKRSIGGLMPSSSSVYNNPSIREPSFSTSSVISSPPSGGGGERRRDGVGNNNGATTLNPSQTLDHRHHHHHNHHRQQLVREPVDPPDPDPVPVSIAVVGAPSSPVAGGGSTTPRSTSNVIRSTTSTIRYRECLKNHAASIGGHVVDGCGEFMPSGEEGTREALKCAACDCHRNFHRKEVDGEPQSGPNCYYCYNPNKADRGSRVPPPPITATPTLVPAPIQQHQNKFQFGLPPNSPQSGPIQPMMMAFGGGGGGATESSSEELNVFHSSGLGAGQPPPPSFGGSSKKRFRTKFSQEQKDKMLEFAEKIGWRIQKQEEAEVQQFCAEVGIKRQVLKVWMHNNKHAMKKKDQL